MRIESDIFYDLSMHPEEELAGGGGSMALCHKPYCS